MASILSTTFSNIHGGHSTVVLGLSWAMGLAVVAAGILLILLLRTRATRRTAVAAHTASGQGSILVDRKGRVLETNGPARNLLWPDHDDRENVLLQESIRVLLDNSGEQHHLLKLGPERLIELSISATMASNRFYGVRGIAVRDVTQQHRGERHLVELAHFDSLTGLGNRRLFIDRLEAAISRANEARERLALLYIDLDRFKDVNDTLGHGAGDALLKTLSDRFRTYLGNVSRPPGGGEVSISRLAGDEFAIIIPQVENSAEVELITADVLRIITEPMTILDRTIASSGSVGIALYPDHASDVEGLVKHADSALYVAKDMGRARFVFYEPVFSAEADRSHRIEQELRKAIGRGELSLHYQPKIDLKTDTAVGFEALARWDNRELGFVGPKEFIPIAEERGMINEIGEWCLNEACLQINVWRDAGFSVVPVSVNVSSIQFRDTDVQRIVTDALVRHSVHPSLIEVELTESLLHEDDEKTGLALRELRSIGVKVALDDFGTGYSALTYLDRFPLDVVKMDRGFLRDIEDSHAAAGIASAVISMSHFLGLEVVAEGVDSPPQAALLRTMGCDQIQGFLFSPAIPSEEATCFLAIDSCARPIVNQMTVSIMPQSSIGEDDPHSDVSGQSFSRRDPMRVETIDPTVPSRVLVIDMVPSTLGMAAIRLMRLDADVHLMTGIEEAKRFVEHEGPVLDLVIAPPAIDLAGLGEVLETLKKRAMNYVPRLLILGPEPDRQRREAIRQSDADWVLWEPYEDPELRFFVTAARSNRDWKFQRQSVRVPIETMAWIRAGAEKGAGVLTSLSRRGAFISTSETFALGQPIQVEFKLESRLVSLFANVTRVHETAQAGTGSLADGIDVIFYDVGSETDATISDAVESHWLRYRP